jgi:ASC-1-like (ASCH) protein
MEHVAIMKKSWGLISKILSGEKTIESRWYQTKRAPWGKINPGDQVFFKNAGEPVVAKAVVWDIMQFEISNVAEAEKIVRKYGKGICLVNTDVKTWGKIPKYCILVFLNNPEEIKNKFGINKKGFGIGAAWISVKNVNKIKK